MQTKELQERDLEIVRAMWSKRGELVSVGFNLRQQYLETEERVYKKLAELDTELNTMMKLVREKTGVSAEWKVDLANGVFVKPDETED